MNTLSLYFPSLNHLGLRAPELPEGVVAPVEGPGLDTSPDVATSARLLSPKPVLLLFVLKHMMHLGLGDAL